MFVMRYFLHEKVSNKTLFWWIVYVVWNLFNVPYHEKRFLELLLQIVFAFMEIHDISEHDQQWTH